MILLELFLSFMQIGLMSVGGGYAAMPLIQSQAVLRHGWMTMSEFADLMTIAEMTPGPIALNAATFVGVRMAGVPGALCATMGCIAPSLAIVSLMAYAYRRMRDLAIVQSVLSGLRPAVVAMIASAGLSILMLVLFGGKSPSMAHVSVSGAALFAAALFALRRLHAGPMTVMLLCGAAGLALGVAFS